MKDYWKDHIAAWANRNDKESCKAEGILVREGWDPDSYRASMKEELHTFLDKWYTLSVKNLPKPATYRSNPIHLNKIIKEIKAPLKRFAYAILSNGWRVDTFFDKGSQSFLTLAYNNLLEKELDPEHSDSISESLYNHDLAVRELLA